MKKLSGFQCEKCQSVFETEEQALHCETEHNDRVKNATIRGWSFGAATGKWGIDRQYNQSYPISISIKFSENFGDVAVYKLDYIGFKGL